MLAKDKYGSIACRISLASVVLWAVVLNGCNPFKGVEQEVVRVEDKVQQAIDELNQGNKTFEDIKNILEGLKGKLDTGEYANQVKDIAGRVGNISQITGQSLVDFTRTRVIEDLQNLKRSILGQPLVPRVPVLANAQMPAVDFTSDSRSTITIGGWNLDMAQKDPKKYKVFIKTVRDGTETEREVATEFVTYQPQYSVTVDVSKSGRLLQFYDKKLYFSGYDTPFEIAVVNSHEPTPPPPIEIKEVYLKVNTTNDDKDREVTFTYIVHLDGKGPRHNTALAVGGGEVWKDPSIRDFTIKLDQPFPEQDRMSYQLRVHYASSDGDPRWIGRVSARGLTSDGRTIDLLSETGDFEMGHHDDGKKTDHIQREFKFNR